MLFASAAHFLPSFRDNIVSRTRHYEISFSLLISSSILETLIARRLHYRTAGLAILAILAREGRRKKKLPPCLYVTRARGPSFSQYRGYFSPTHVARARVYIYDQFPAIIVARFLRAHTREFSAARETHTRARARIYANYSRLPFAPVSSGREEGRAPTRPRRR